MCETLLVWLTLLINSSFLLTAATLSHCIRLYVGQNLWKRINKLPSFFFFFALVNRFLIPIGHNISFALLLHCCDSNCWSKLSPHELYPCLRKLTLNLSLTIFSPMSYLVLRTGFNEIMFISTFDLKDERCF